MKVTEAQMQSFPQRYVPGLTRVLARSNPGGEEFSEQRVKSELRAPQIMNLGREEVKLFASVGELPCSCLMIILDSVALQKEEGRSLCGPELQAGGPQREVGSLEAHGHGALGRGGQHWSTGDLFTPLSAAFSEEDEGQPGVAVKLFEVRPGF